MYEQETTKYRIHLIVHAEGIVDRSDVVGAIFGQIEGLLGSELELRELQRQGKLGRIDVKVQSKLGRSYGEITIPTSLDRAETAILAASMETINRIGPCMSEISVSNIEDIRVTKRTQIIERAKALLLEFEEIGIDPDSLIDAVRESQRIEKIEVIGQDNIPAGPNVLGSDAIIVVEGRADVINLLRSGIKNAVAVEGTSIPETIIELCRKKTATAFFDGDRGGDLILRELLEIAEVDFVAYPPRGESVEDLTRKEIIKSLRNKVPIDYVLEDRIDEYLAHLDQEKKLPEDTIIRFEQNEQNYDIVENEEQNCEQPVQEATEIIQEQALDPIPFLETRPRTVFAHMNEVRHTGTARFINEEGEVTLEIPASEIEEQFAGIDKDANIEGIVIDLEINQKLLDQLSRYDIKYLAAPVFSGIVRIPAKLRLIPFR